jgi:aminoglycoside N3'-acetyltransferase
MRNLAASLRSRWDRWSARLYSRVTRRQVVGALRELGVRNGDVLCVHSSLASLGHVVGGAEALIDALLDAVGGPSEGTLMMPTFCMHGSMKEYLDEASGIDLRSAPSRVGRLTEVFRVRPGARRSAHPSNPVSAEGALAEALVAGHERSPTPYGRETPYGRLGELDNGKVLLINTIFLSLLHRLQEAVDFPGLFVPGMQRVQFTDTSGVLHSLETRVMKPRLPYVILLPGREDAFVHLDDYPFVQPLGRMPLFEGTQYYQDNIASWRRLEKLLTAKAGFRRSRLGRAEIAVVESKGFMDLLTRDLGELVEARRADYRDEFVAPLLKGYRELTASRAAAIR